VVTLRRFAGTHAPRVHAHACEAARQARVRVPDVPAGPASGPPKPPAALQATG
jgi:hypothetical protein